MPEGDTIHRTRFDRRLAALGPDVLAGELDEAAFLRRLREDDPTRRGQGDDNRTTYWRPGCQR